MTPAWCHECETPLEARCDRCRTRACATCDYCHGCGHIVCERCNREGTPVFAYPGDVYAHPHDPDGRWRPVTPP